MAGFFKNLFSKKQTPRRNPDLVVVDELPEDIDYVRDVAKQLVRGGYLPRAEICDAVRDAIEDEGFSYPAEILVDTEIENLVAESQNWEGPLDYDRLHGAMKTLEAKGIVARENFTCCNTCGNAEIGMEIDDYEKASGESARGYTFFHQQDTESAAEGYGVYLAYGRAADNGTEEDSVNIGKEIAETMSQAGLNIKWDGSLNQKIFVDLDWKRPWEG